MIILAARGLPEGASSCVSVTLPGRADPVVSEMVAEAAEPTFNFDVEYTVATDDASLTELVTTPVVIKLLDGARASLGELTLSLEPMLGSAMMEEEWLECAEGGLALLVSVSAERPVLTEDELEETTVFRSEIVAMHRLPVSLQLVQGQGEADDLFVYTAVLKVAGIEAPFVFPGGTIALPPPPAEEAGPTPDPNAPEDASETGAAAKGAAEEEEEDRLEGQFISWRGASTTLFLGVEAYNRMRAGIERGEPPVSVSVHRTPKEPQAVLDTNAARYAALAPLKLVSLLEVDSRFHAGRFAVRHDAAYVHVAPETDPKSKKGPAPLAQEAPLEEGAPHPYEAAGTLLRVDITTSYPFNPRPPTPPPPLPKTTDLIPKRTLPALAQRAAGAEFESKVKEIVESLAAEWSALFPTVEPDPADGDEARDARRRELLYQLNSTGQYYDFKEKLKRSVVRLAREVGKRPRGEAPDPATMQAFYNKLYVALTKRMHAALDATFFPAVEPPTAPSAPAPPDETSTGAVLATLAAEAEALFRFGEAAQCHQERVATSPLDSAAWHAYAAFLLRTGQKAKAEECSREALALEPASAEALLAYGATLSSRSHHEQAEVFLKAALDAAPDDAQLWLLMGLLYERMDRRRDVRIALKQAAALAGEAGLEPHYVSLAKRLLPYAAAPLVERAVELSAGADAVGAALLLAQLQLQRGELSAAEESLAAAAEGAPKAKAAALLTLLGHAQLRQQKTEQARATYEKALALCRDPLPVPLLLHLGALSLGAGDATRARYLFLHASRLEPSCASWLGAGSACLALSEYAEAEECLCEANVRNNRDAAVWAQLALLCARRERADEAEQALEQTARLDLADGPLLHELGVALSDCGRYRAAEDCFRRSLLFMPAAQTEKRLADAQLEQHSYKDALASYKRALSSAEAEQEAAVAAECTAQIELVQGHLGV